MSKPFNPIQEGKTDSDLTKRVLRGISDVVRCLDDVRGRALAVHELFLPAVELQRSKLHELSYRLILIDPQGCGKRGEEFLWKKGYHDVFSTARRLRQGETWEENDSALVRGLLLSGIGYYQNLILRLQADYDLHSDGVVDFTLPVADYGLGKGKSVNGKHEEAPWADALVGRCLLYLGDLSRYLKELEPQWDFGMAERFYLQSSKLNVKQGRPFNQLGTLAGNRYYSLDAVYYYMRSLSCAEAFDGAAGNLSKALEENASAVELEEFRPVAASPTFRVISRFLLVVDAWHFGKRIDNIHLLCSEVVEAFSQVVHSNGNKHRDHQPDWDAPFPPSELSDQLPSNVLLNIFAILFMCWEKLNSAESPQHLEVTACLLSMLDTILQKLVKRFESAQLDRKKRKLRRRRRRRSSDTSSISGPSGEESVDEMELGDSPEVSSGDEIDDQVNGYSNGINGQSEEDYPREKWIEDDLLAVLHILCSWLRYHGDALSRCPSSSKPILENLIKILNALFSYLGGDLKHKGLKSCKFPTREEVQLQGVPGLEKSQEELDWSLKCRRLSKKEESILRAHRIINVCEHVRELSLNKATKRFQLAKDRENTPPPPVETLSEENKGKLMKNMGQLWLKAEVKDLENRVRKTPADFSTYLVVDAVALVEHITLIKQLVGSRQFIVVIPAVVLSHLDECKKESGRAREAIRWLESQFQHGNRHLRSQKAQEKAPLGVIKYPKKKDKDAWNFFQIMECCNYLSKQRELRCKAGGKVTFLTGAKDVNIIDSRTPPTPAAEFSPSGLASSFGVTLEHVETFHGKWKLTCKSHG